MNFDDLVLVMGIGLASVGLLALGVILLGYTIKRKDRSK